MCASRLLVNGCKKERVRAAALINTWFSVEPCCTVAGVRKRLLASGIKRGRSSVQRHDGGALASEAGDMWVKVQGPRLHCFLSLPQVNNRHLRSTPKHLAVATRGLG